MPHTRSHTDRQTDPVLLLPPPPPTHTHIDTKFGAAGQKSKPKEAVNNGLCSGSEQRPTKRQKQIYCNRRN